MAQTGRKRGNSPARGGAVRLLTLAAVFIALLAAPPAFADVIAVRVDGSAARDSAEGDAKKAARDAALAAAVTEAAERLDIARGEEGRVLLERVASEPLRFILNYRILSEGWTRTGPAGPGRPLEGDPDSPPEAWMEEGPMWPGEWKEAEDVYRIRIEASVDGVALTRAMNRAAAGGELEGLPIRLVLLDMVDFPSYDSFRGTLEGISMVEDIGYDTFYRGRIVYRVKAAGDPSELKAAIESKTRGRYEVGYGGPRTITVRPLERARQW